MKKTTLALLSMALVLQASADVHLLPCGEFVGRDGRPGNGLTWKQSDAQGRALAAHLTAKHSRVQFNFDYEHQALLSETNGQPAPASGWATQFEWRDGIGLFALNVAWTATAKNMIEGGEYKYISPAIVFDTKTGEVLEILNASLVNIPNLDLNPVAQERVARLNASFSTHQDNHMNPVLKALLTALGLPVTDATTVEQARGAVAALKAQAASVPAPVVTALALGDTATPEEVATAVATLKAKADTATSEVAALKASNPDPTKWVAFDKFTELSNQVATLSAQGANREVDELLEGARKEGKCTPVVESVWRDVGKKDIAMLKALIDKTPANPALAGQIQTAANKVNQDAPGALTAEQKAMCKQLGLKQEDYLATLKAQAQQAVSA